MLAFVRSGTAYEVRNIHPTLWTILREISDFLWTEYTGQENVLVTELFRTSAETLRIYTEAGLVPPAASVHGAVKVFGDPLSGCRGADLSVRMHRLGMRYEDWPILPPGISRKFVEAVNKRWQYQASEEHSVALYHSVNGPHIHLQVRAGNETVRREISPEA